MSTTATLSFRTLLLTVEIGTVLCLPSVKLAGEGHRNSLLHEPMDDDAAPVVLDNNLVSDSDAFSKWLTEEELVTASEQVASKGERPSSPTGLNADAAAASLSSNSAAFADGDMVRGSWSAAQRQQDAVDAKQNAARSPADAIWPQGVIPYEVSGRFREPARQRIAYAFMEVMDKSCIRFEPRDTHADYMFITPVDAQGSVGCSSDVGRIGGRQNLTLSSARCFDATGIIVHELMHTIGFFHEQARYDRDEYVQINRQNIEAGLERNFIRYNSFEVTQLRTLYDYDSLMHYPADAFSRNGEPTIVPLVRGVSIGQRDRLSQLDVYEVNKLYQCFSAPEEPPPIPPYAALIGRQPGIDVCTHGRLVDNQAVGSEQVDCSSEPPAMICQCFAGTFGHYGSLGTSCHQKMDKRVMRRMEYLYDIDLTQITGLDNVDRFAASDNYIYVLRSADSWSHRGDHLLRFPRRLHTPSDADVELVFDATKRGMKIMYVKAMPDNHLALLLVGNAGESDYESGESFEDGDGAYFVSGDDTERNAFVILDEGDYAAPKNYLVIDRPALVYESQSSNSATLLPLREYDGYYVSVPRNDGRIYFVEADGQVVRTLRKPADCSDALRFFPQDVEFSDENLAYGDMFDMDILSDGKVIVRSLDNLIVLNAENNTLYNLIKVVPGALMSTTANWVKTDAFDHIVTFALNDTSNSFWNRRAEHLRGFFAVYDQTGSLLSQSDAFNDQCDDMAVSANDGHVFWRQISRNGHPGKISVFRYLKDRCLEGAYTNHSSLLLRICPIDKVPKQPCLCREGVFGVNCDKILPKSTTMLPRMLESGSFNMSQPIIDPDGVILSFPSYGGTDRLHPWETRHTTLAITKDYLYINDFAYTRLSRYRIDPIDGSLRDLELNISWSSQPFGWDNIFGLLDLGDGRIALFTTPFCTYDGHGDRDFVVAIYNENPFSLAKSFKIDFDAAFSQQFRLFLLPDNVNNHYLLSAPLLKTVFEFRENNLQLSAIKQATGCDNITFPFNFNMDLSKDGDFICVAALDRIFILNSIDFSILTAFPSPPSRRFIYKDLPNGAPGPLTDTEVYRIFIDDYENVIVFASGKGSRFGRFVVADPVGRLLSEGPPMREPLLWAPNKRNGHIYFVRPRRPFVMDSFRYF